MDNLLKNNEKSPGSKWFGWALFLCLAGAGIYWASLHEQSVREAAEVEKAAAEEARKARRAEEGSAKKEKRENGVRVFQEKADAFTAQIAALPGIESAEFHFDGSSAIGWISISHQLYRDSKRLGVDGEKAFYDIHEMANAYFEVRFVPIHIKSGGRAVAKVDRRSLFSREALLAWED